MVEAVRLKAVLGSNAILLLFILVLILLGFRDHAFNILLAETTLVVGDGNLFLFSGRLIDGRHVEDAVGVNVESDLDLGNTARCGRDSGQIEFSEKMVVPGHGAFTFINLNKNKFENFEPFNICQFNILSTKGILK